MEAYKNNKTIGERVLSSNSGKGVALDSRPTSSMDFSKLEEEEDEDDEDEEPDSSNSVDTLSPESASSNPGETQLGSSSNMPSNIISRAGDRVMSRRSAQQAPASDIFARPPSAYRPGTGRLSSVNTISNADALDALSSFESDDLSRGVRERDYVVQRSFDDVAVTPPIAKQRPSSSLKKTSMSDILKSSELDHFPVSEEITGLFQYIEHYKPQDVDIGTVLKPFLPEFIPALGTVDEFIKVPRPDGLPDHLGLKVLDEDGPRQSDPAVLILQLRSASMQSSIHPLEVASIENVDKNPKKLDAWINSIKDLHRTKPPPCVIYSKPMPDMENLMQEWPAEIEKVLSEIELPSANLDVDLATFVDICCSILDIPVYKSRIQSLHVLFSLYLDFKNNPQFSSTWAGR